MIFASSLSIRLSSPPSSQNPPQFLQWCRMMCVSPRNRTRDKSNPSHRGQYLTWDSGVLSSSSEQNSMLPSTLNAILSSSPPSSQRLPHFSQLSYDSSPCLVVTS